MDKETLSNYGWIVICVLVLAVMIALATPFGTFVADAVKSTTQGLFDVNQNALNSTGLINIDGQEFDSCAHDYEVTTTGDCSVGQITTTQTCKFCGKTSSETTSATHTWDNTGLTCTECGTKVVEYAFNPSDYDAKMGTTTSTDAVVVIPETFECDGVNYKVTSIGMNAFKGCTSLEKIVLPNGLTKIGDSAFRSCTSLVEVNIPNSVTVIWANAFNNCRSLQTITIPSSVSTFMGGAFQGCISLTNITLQEGLKEIPGLAFESCVSLQTITIPSSVTKIGQMSFAKDKELKNIVFLGTVEQWNAITFGSDWNGMTYYFIPATEVICSDGTVSLS